MIEMFLFKSGGIALAVAALFFLTGILPDRVKTRMQAVVLAMAFVAIYYCYMGPPTWPPTGGLPALPWVALTLAAYLWIYPVHFGTRYAVRALFVLIVGAICLWSLFDHIKGSQTGPRNAAAFFCLGLGVWSIIEKASEKTNVAILALLPMIALLASSFLFLLEGSASLSQLGISMAMLFGVVMAIGFFWPRKISHAALVPFLSIFVIAMMVVGHFFVEINPWRLIMMSWPFLILWIRRAIPFLPKSQIAELAVLTVLAVAPVAYWLSSIYKATGGLQH
jgi:hypothetical protein